MKLFEKDDMKTMEDTQVFLTWMFLILFIFAMILAKYEIVTENHLIDKFKLWID